jgi:hypothetical protein
MLRASALRVRSSSAPRSASALKLPQLLSSSDWIRAIGMPGWTVMAAVRGLEPPSHCLDGWTHPAEPRSSSRAIRASEIEGSASGTRVCHPALLRLHLCTVWPMLLTKRYGPIPFGILTNAHQT